MNSKTAISIGVVVLVAVAFFGGYKYASAKSAGAAAKGQFAQGGMRGMGAGRFGGANGGAAFGQIISKDDKSITVTTQGGGSKIVFLSASTTISKMAEGSLADLSIGQDVTVMGTPNSDGSLTAATISIRQAPAGK